MNGKLTADDVRKAIFICGVWDEDGAMCHVSRTDMQAIADELNATLCGNPSTIGTCERCYYAADVGLNNARFGRGKVYECHRYPEILYKKRDYYCGEFAPKHDVQNVGDA